jgi:hypothetical protein
LFYRCHKIKHVLDELKHIFNSIFEKNIVLVEENLIIGVYEGEITEKTITVTVTDLDDEAPTNIQIRNINTNLLSSVVISITLAVFSGVEKLAFVVIENANAWNDDT